MTVMETGSFTFAISDVTIYVQRGVIKGNAVLTWPPWVCNNKR